MVAAGAATSQLVTRGAKVEAASVSTMEAARGVKRLGAIIRVRAQVVNAYLTEAAKAAMRRAVIS